MEPICGVNSPNSPDLYDMIPGIVEIVRGVKIIFCKNTVSLNDLSQEQDKPGLLLQAVSDRDLTVGIAESR